MTPMHIKELWRYPVKSLAGERLAEATITPNGIDGDRRVVIVDEAHGRIVTSRTHPRLLAARGTLGPDGEPLIDGRRWDDPASAAAIAHAAGPGAQLIATGDPRRFDVLPLLVATDGALEAFGYDGRRLRPNIVIGGVNGLAEREWPGRLLRIGADVVLELAQLRSRCVMTTYDPDTQEQDHEVLRRLVREFDGTMALDTAVVSGGHVAVGDPVELL